MLPKREKIYVKYTDKCCYKKVEYGSVHGCSDAVKKFKAQHLTLINFRAPLILTGQFPELAGRGQFRELAVREN